MLHIIVRLTACMHACMVYLLIQPHMIPQNPQPHQDLGVVKLLLILLKKCAGTKIYYAKERLPEPNAHAEHRQNSVSCMEI